MRNGISGHTVRSLAAIVIALRRLALTLTLLVLVPTAGVAATRGPDAAGYTATDATLFSFDDLAGVAGAVGLLADIDDGTVVLTLPFAFQFYGQSYTQVCVSSNGALYFVTDPKQCEGVVDFANVDLSAANTPGNLPALLPLWGDLTFQASGAGSVLYHTIGSAGSRRFIVQWNDAHTGTPLKPVNVQLVLLEGVNKILFQYKGVDLGDGNKATKGGEATVGIRGANAVAGNTRIQWSYNAPVLSNELAVMFSPAGKTTPTITWPSPANITYGTALGATQLNATANQPGTFTYAPPAGTVLPVGANQQLKVTFTPSDPATVESAEATRTITVLVPTVTLVSPTSAVYAGSQTLITWTANGAATSYDVQLSRDGGPFANITGCVALSGSATSCSWTPAGPATANARLRVILHAGAATASDDSDAAFAISTTVPTLTLRAPVSGERWAIGLPKTIRWSHAMGAGTFVKVELSRNNGTAWSVLAASVANTSATAGEFTWTVTGPVTTTAKLRVTALDSPATSTSPAFKIENPSILVAAPNKVVTVAVGSKLSIQFDTNLGQGQQVAFHISRDGGASWSSIGTATTTSVVRNAFVWTVTGPATTQALIKVSWTANVAVADSSDQKFTIR